MEKTPIDGQEKVVQEWNEKCNDPEHSTTMKVPVFNVEYSNKEWGGQKIEVLRINCAEDDAPYLKYLLSTSSVKGDTTKGILILTGIHLMEGKEVLTSILKEQLDYIESTIGVPKNGITEDAMNIPKNSEKNQLNKN